MNSNLGGSPTYQENDACNITWTCTMYKLQVIKKNTVKSLYFVGAQLPWISWNKTATNLRPQRKMFSKEIGTTSYTD